MNQKIYKKFDKLKLECLKHRNYKTLSLLRFQSYSSISTNVKKI